MNKSKFPWRLWRLTLEHENLLLLDKEQIVWFKLFASEFYKQ